MWGIVLFMCWSWGYREKLRGWRQWGRGCVVCIILWVTENGEHLEPPSAQRGQGRETLGTGRLKERELKSQKEWERGGSCHHMGWIKPQLADFIHPCLPRFPSTSLSQTSPSISRPSLREKQEIAMFLVHSLLNLWIWFLFLQSHYTKRCTQTYFVLFFLV